MRFWSTWLRLWPRFRRATPVMSLNPSIVDETVLCNGRTQERSRSGWVDQPGVAGAARPAVARAAGPGWVRGRLTGRAAPQMREGGLPVHPRRVARAVCVSVGGRSSGLRASRPVRGRPEPVGGLRATTAVAGGDLRDQPGVVVPQGTGLVGGH